MYGFPTTATSDWDYYAVGWSDKIKPYKFYPNIKIHQKKRTPNLDVEKVELCAYLSYLMNGFVFQVESLFVPRNWMDWLDPKFEELVLNKKHLLIDRTRFIENFGDNVDITRRKTVADIEKLKNEVLARKPGPKIANGVTKMLDEYKAKGYYHKDYLHQIRIAACILHFMKTDVYPLTTLKEADPSAFEFCSALKTEPGRFSRAELDAFLDEYLHNIDKCSLENDEEKFRFDTGHALNIIKEFDISGKTK